MKRKYDVKKQKVVRGSDFLEDTYNANPENLCGLWVKYGQGKIQNPSVEKVLCESCQDATLHYREKESILKMKRSYQVENFTEPRQLYEWDRVGCKGESCWGPKERYFKVSRKNRKTYNEDGFQYMLSQFIVHDGGNEECVDRVYLNVQLKNSRKWIYEGIGSQRRIRQFFFPNLVDKEQEHFVYVSCRQFERSTDNFKYPIVWKIEHFKKNKEVLRFPSSVKDLDDDHHPASRTFMELYPGGSGLRISQYKFVENVEFKPTTCYGLSYGTGGLEINYSPPFWVQEINKDHLSPDEVFIENVQDGFCGPIVSFYERYHSNNSFFL